MVAAIKNLNMENPRRFGSVEGVENLQRRLSMFMAPVYPRAFQASQDPRRRRELRDALQRGVFVSGYPEQPSGEGVEVT
jgi:hypothetical protein